jgi:hypothetical protein
LIIINVASRNGSIKFHYYFPASHHQVTHHHVMVLYSNKAQFCLQTLDMSTSRFFTTITGIFITGFLSAQNVGVGTATPAEKLDVNGNINVSGTIKANGVDGQPNQVLMKNSSGILAWGSMSEYKNMVTFTDTTGTITWPVPAGVTKVWVELWGGGGAGLEAGGGGGGYLSVVVNIVAGENVHVTVGKGGTDNPTIGASSASAKSGTTSRFEHNAVNYDANGGQGALNSTALSYPQYSPGRGGAFFLTIPATTNPRGTFYAEAGESGGPLILHYQQLTSNQYAQTRTYGDGGAAANTSNFRSKGAVEQYMFIVSPASSARSYYVSSRPGSFPGGGGSGGPDLSADQREGANGLVIIHY